MTNWQTTLDEFYKGGGGGINDTGDASRADIVGNSNSLTARATR